MAGMKNKDAGMIEHSTGMISQEPGLINGNAGMIDECSGLITENDSEEDTSTGRRKRRRERGKDSKPRNFPLHTMKNLPQFRDKSHEEVRRYILEKKGVDIGSNYNWSNTMMWTLIVLVLIASGIGIWKLYQQHVQKKKAE